MKLAILGIIAVAILGIIGLEVSKSSGKASPSASAAQTTTSTDTNTQPSTPSSSGTAATAVYKDGTYTGDSDSNPYGTVQIAVVISGGKISDVNFLQMPGGEGRTNMLTMMSKGPLKDSTLAKQN